MPRLLPDQLLYYLDGVSKPIVLRNWNLFFVFLGRTSDASNSIASELNRVDLLIISNDVCRNTFGVIVQPQHICTSGQGVVGGCNGDSGGPLTVNGLQVGIVSFGSAQCEAQNPTAYARVSHFIDWIEESVARM